MYFDCAVVSWWSTVCEIVFCVVLMPAIYFVSSRHYIVTWDPKTIVVGKFILRLRVLFILSFSELFVKEFYLFYLNKGLEFNVCFTL